MLHEELSEESHSYSEPNTLKFQCSTIFLRGHVMEHVRAVLRAQLGMSSVALIRLAMNSRQYLNTFYNVLLWCLSDLTYLTRGIWLIFS